MPDYARIGSLLSCKRFNHTDILAELNGLNTLSNIMLSSIKWDKPAAALLIVLVLAATLRLSLLGSKSLWFDESSSVYFAHLPTEKLWHLGWSQPEPHPPLYYHILSYWVDWFGDSETSVRLPSALVSLVAVALIYVLGRRLFNYRVGALAAALLAISPLHIWYAQEARMYAPMTTIMLLCAVLLTWNSWWAIPPLTATFAIGLYTDYTMLPIWSIVSAIWFVSWWQHGRPSRPFLIWLTASILAWLLYLPWLGNLYAVLESFPRVHIFVSLNEAIGVPFLTPEQYLFVMILGTLLLMPFLVLINHLQRSEKTGKWVSAAVLGGFIFATLLFPIPRFYGIKRILVLVWPLFILWVAWVVIHLDYQRQRVLWSVLALSFAMSLITLFAVPKDDWRGAVTHVNEHALESDVAWIDPRYNRLALIYYDLKLEIETEKNGSGDIWFFAERIPGQPAPSSVSEQFLEENLELVEAIPFYRLEVRRYRSKE